MSAPSATSAALDIYESDALSWLDRMAERLYARSPRAMFLAVAGFCLLSGVSVTAAALVTGIRYWVRYLDLTAQQAAPIVVTAGVATVVALSMALVMGYRTFAPFALWLKEKTEATAPTEWTGAAYFSLRLIRTGVLIFSVAFVPVVVVICTTVDLSITAGLFLFLYIEFAICFAAILDYFVVERLTNPMFRDLARFLPDGFVPEPRLPSLNLRIFPVITLVSIFTSITVSAFQPQGATPATTFAFMLLVPIAVSLTLGLVPLLLLIQSLVGPISLLRSVAGRVEAGDLTARAPVCSADEVGELTGSFNRMVKGLLDGLGDRERLAVEVRESRSRIVAAADESRKRIERNIHDGAQQRLVALALDLRMLEEQVHTSSHEDLASALRRTGSDVKEALIELRELARGLHPSVLTTDGLAPAIEQLASRSSIPVTVSVLPTRFPEAVETACYFTVAEALANVAKYAQATAAGVRIEQQDGHICLEVSDNGSGGADPTAGSGLTGLADRIAALDGELLVNSPVGEGTTVTVVLPVATTTNRPPHGT